MAYPANVLHLATECGNKNHSAAFPQELPAWFIKLFSDEGDWVLDPFVGSGTTCKTAQELGRNSVGIDLMAEYCEMAKEEVHPAERLLMERPATYGKHQHSRANKVH